MKASTPSKLTTAKTLSEFLNLVKTYRKEWAGQGQINVKADQKAIWFRGQHEAAWSLQPKIYRRGFQYADEAEIRQEFQSRAVQMIQGRLPANKWEWYFLMQHYGAPTRLLDWTDNPLVALFFALDQHRGHADAAVWVLDPWWLNARLHIRGVEGPFEIDWDESSSWLADLQDAFGSPSRGVRKAGPAAIEPPHVDRRVAMQHSRFVIFGKTKDLLKTKAAREPARTCRLSRIEIPSAAIHDMYDELESAGFTTSAIYPDLAGLCAELSDRWRFSRGTK